MAAVISAATYSRRRHDRQHHTVPVDPWDGRVAVGDLRFTRKAHGGINEYTIELQVSGGSLNVSIGWAVFIGDGHLDGCAILAGEQNCLADFTFVTWTSG
jgi:hypothetical protein